MEKPLRRLKLLSIKEQEFRERVSNFREDFYPYAYSLTKNHFDSEDLLQESLLRAIQNFHNFREDRNLKGWVRTVLYNTFINSYWEKARKYTQINIDDIPEVLDNRCLVESLELDDDYLDSEIRKVLRDLPWQFKSVLLLYSIAGYEYKEIAKMLKIPLGTVMSRIFRARKWLQVRLRDYGINLGYLKGEKNVSIK